MSIEKSKNVKVYRTHLVENVKVGKVFGGTGLL